LNIRPFDGTLRDAQGIIEVDRETFGDCDYTPGYIVALQADPRQSAWLAVDAKSGRVAGFVSAFDTHSMTGARWEVDELAVRPAFQGRGLGTQLVARAALGASTPPGLTEIRAMIATGNVASQRAFGKNGFHPAAAVDLLLYQVTGRAPRPRAEGAPAVRTADIEDAPVIAALAARPVSDIVALLHRPENVCLLAEQGETVLGCAELIHVRTLQYQGFWIESLALKAPNRRTAQALFSAAIDDAKRHPEMDRVGYMTPPGDELRYTTCVSQGFQKIAAYLPFVKATSRQ
jgi:GNAT superfamily N-acetyltransferase